MKKATVIASLLLFMFLLWKCGDRQFDQSTGQEESVVETQPVRMEYAELTFEQRKAKLAECASCHPDETHNELIGPHAQAYTKLLEHYEMAEDTNCFQSPYAHFIKDNIAESACADCHAPVNLFENSYIGLDTLADVSVFTKVAFPEAWNVPTSRKGEENRLSGIDCLSCHLQGNEVITTADYKPSNGELPSCNPRGSAFFSSNFVCVSCHALTIMESENNINNQSLLADMSCNGCHMEKNEDGEFSHYYYWRHDHESKNQFPLLKAVFGDLEVNKGTDGIFSLSWKNEQATHPVTLCPDLYAVISFVDKDGQVCEKTELHLNKKRLHDSRSLGPYFGDTTIWGKYGCQFLPSENGCPDTVAVTNCNIKEVRIEGYEKPQYWMSDSFAQKIYFRTIQF